ncbi:sugar phosphate isomerase/epimerase family protein [Paenibacillus piri]|uniref:Xylose isomerase n=1 Tax=Paenibacillus piri TaxID=2547395 RepID=A0A4R5KLZ7_9BACL|nr:TIM barrel protein [Paenibacillus piri]TDF95945.1 xylose isomerase [Paenibacillus piri]
MPELTMLNSMASRDFAAALDRLAGWGIRALDLKDSIFGKTVFDLTRIEAEQAIAMAERRGQYVYCMSTAIFQDDIEQGEASFRTAHQRLIERASTVAAVLKPKLLRVLSAKSSKRHSITDSIRYMESHHPWVFEAYRSVIDRFREEGVMVTIENDPQSNILGSVDEITGFFERLDRPDHTHFTFDVQNLWQMGVFPTMDVYAQLRPLIGYLHVKGGLKHPVTGELQWKSSLEDASWPVAAMCKQAAADGVSPVICLNPPHGAARPGCDYNGMEQRDLAYLKSLFAAELE